MKEKDELTDLFRSRLKQAQLEVRDGFWESLEQDLPASPAFPFYRFAAAASVLLILGMASAAFWLFSPKEEMQKAFTVAQQMGEKMVEENQSIQHAKSIIPAAPVSVSNDGSNLAGMESVHFSISIRQRVSGHNRRFSPEYQPTSTVAVSEQNQSSSVSTSIADVRESDESQASKWALKVAAGVSLPKGKGQLPAIGSVSVERFLGKRFSLETGLQYYRLTTGGDSDEILHAVAVPVRLNVACVDFKRWSCYASVGGAVEKVVNKGFHEDPLRLSVSAGVGAAYKINERLALFVEPSISHHFDTESRLQSIRTARATNMNLLCGLRMTY